MKTAYQLACGAYDQKDYGKVRIRLWMEHNRYHVRAHNSDTGRVFWEVFDTLKAAREYYHYRFEPVVKV
jgi:hypothetical protein